VESLATENGYLLLICTTGAEGEREREVITTLQEQRAFAVLLVGSTDSGEPFESRVAQYAQDLATIDAPLIFCGRPPIDCLPGIVSVGYDQEAGIAAAVEHLGSLGHREIVYVGQPRGQTTPELRMDGYIAAMKKVGLAEPRIVEADNTEEDSARVVAGLLDAGTAATALVCMTDNIAVGAYRALRALGMRIPEDMSVVGFDDVPIVADLTPGLTTVRPPFREVGVEAAEIALGLRPSKNVLLAPQLIVRGSTARPGGRSGGSS
jgi:LacI family transcriptional regulator